MTNFTIVIGGRSKTQLLALNRPGTKVMDDVLRLMSFPAFVTGERQTVRVSRVWRSSLGFKGKYDVNDVMKKIRDRGGTPFFPDAAFHLLDAPINLKENTVLIDMEPILDDEGRAFVFAIRESYAGIRYLNAVSTNRHADGIDGVLCIDPIQDA